jgi:hypothetical protein
MWIFGRTAPTVDLGEVDLPEGILVILDPGLARFWRQDADPTSPRRSDPEMHDLRIVGPDAVEAGRAYDREFDARFLYDQDQPEDAARHFEQFARQRGFEARAQRLPSRVPHTERTHRALEYGQGLGVVKYNGIWAVAVGGLPKDRSLRVIGVPMPRGEFEGRWRSIDLVIDDKAKIVHSEQVDGVMVDHGQLLFAGLGPLGHFRMWESIDGLADFVFHGQDAPTLAREVGASDFGDGEYGWKDVPMELIDDRAQFVQQRIEKEGLGAGVDYRPHCNLERLNAQIRKSPEQVGKLVLAGSRVVGCVNRWGDGIYTVSRHSDAKGRIVRIRVELGTERHQKLLRQVHLRHQNAIITRAVLDDGHPIRFADHLEPISEHDSGWAFSAGIEDDAYMRDSNNLIVVPLGTLLARFPELDAILDAPVGALFRRKGDRFVEDKP